MPKYDQSLSVVQSVMYIVSARAGSKGKEELELDESKSFRCISTLENAPEHPQWDRQLTGVPVNGTSLSQPLSIA